MGKKREGMQRMLVIINKLKGPQQYVPRKELENYVTHRMEERDGSREYRRRCSCSPPCGADPCAPPSFPGECGNKTATRTAGSSPCRSVEARFPVG